ncbi:MAG: ferrochelatase [Chitinivibrionales bacterium]|nr:ferrochelatase [Chitinivibrionales bacterium]
MNDTTGVLFMAYGGPDSLEDIPGYLADIRNTRPTPKRILDEIADHYRLIGGKSPLRDISSKQVAAVKHRLDSTCFTCYLGMRHWRPWIADAVARMIDDGITRAISIVLAPHYSSMSVAKYQAQIDNAQHLHHGTIAFRHVNAYHTNTSLIAGLALRVQEGLLKWEARERDDVHVIFSAHSLPQRILDNGDSYDASVKETARCVAQDCALSASQWSWSYQSAGRSNEPWLGPTLLETLQELPGRGIDNVLVCPVGFVADHVEILYDLDIEAKQQAGRLGIRIERVAALNDHPLFLQALVDTIHEAVAHLES